MPAKTQETRQLIFTLTPQLDISRAVLTSDTSEALLRYIHEEIFSLGKNPEWIVPKWITSILVRNCNDISRLSHDELQYIIRKELSNHEEKDIRTIPLFDAWFCDQHGMNPLMDECRHDKLRTHEDYGFWKYEMTPELIEDDHLLHGIRTDRGLHLFSSDNIGYQAMFQCLTYYTMHLFDKQSGISYLELLMLYPLEGFVPTVGHRFLNRENWECSPAELPDEYFSDNITAVYLVGKKFDMAPTLANDLELRHNNGIAELEIMPSIHDFTCLALLHEGRVARPEDIEEEWYACFSYKSRFCELVDDLDDCDNAEERATVSCQIRTLAGEIMQKEFPDMHYRPERQMEQNINSEYKHTPTFKFRSV